jgi:hypothetical protein
MSTYSEGPSMDTFNKPATVPPVATPPKAPQPPKKTVVDIKKQTVIPVVKKATMGPGVVMSAPKAWVSGKAYHKKAQVTLEGKTYQSKKNDNLNTPSTSSTDWSLVK